MTQVPKNQLSYSAFMDEIDVWELALRREVEKIQTIKKLPLAQQPRMKNRIELIQTEIASQLIKYRKEKDKVSTFSKQLLRRRPEFEYVMYKYDQFSRKFVQLMETLNYIHNAVTVEDDNDFEVNVSIQSKRQSNHKSRMRNSRSAYSSIRQDENNLNTGNTPRDDSDNNRTQFVRTTLQHVPHNSRNQLKGYLHETFSAKMSYGNSKASGNKKATNKTANLINKLDTNIEWLQNLVKTSTNKQRSNKSYCPDPNVATQLRKKQLLQQQEESLKSRTTAAFFSNNQASTNPRSRNVSFDNTSNSNGEGLLDIRTQLREIKNKVLDISKKTDTHCHESYEKEINRLKQNNQKIMLDLKMMKQDNNTLLHQIYQARKDINEEKVNRQNLQRGIADSEKMKKKTITLQKHVTPFPEEQSILSQYYFTIVIHDMQCERVGESETITVLI